MGVIIKITVINSLALPGEGQLDVSVRLASSHAISTTEQSRFLASDNVALAAFAV